MRGGWSMGEVAAPIDPRIPKRTASVDIRTLPLHPEEAFVLSRVDGATNETELVLGTGLDAARVRAALERLRDLDLIQFEPIPPPGPDPRARPSTGATEVRAAPTTLPSPAAKPGPPPSSAPRVLDEHIGQEIDVRSAELAGADHYQALGVPRNASRQTIKNAYFALISRLHPDRFFGIDLGARKVLLERLFTRWTEAHDTLTRSALRTAYDQSLPPLAPPAAGPRRDFAATPEMAEPGAEWGPPSAPGSDSGARRLAFARRLRSQVPAPPSTPSAHPAAAGNAAVTLPAPSRHSDVPANGDRTASDGLLARAKAALESGLCADAATLYGQAARVSQDPTAYQYAAEAALRAGDNAKMAADYALHGLRLAPAHVPLRLLLASIYAGAGMRSSALAELEKARQLGPDDDTIHAWLERTKPRA